MALTTVDDAKTFLGIPSSDTSEDARISMFIDDAEAVFTDFCRGRRFAREVYSEYFSGDGTNFLLMNQCPVLSVLEVRVDDDGYWGQAVNDDGTLPFDDDTIQDLGTYALALDNSLMGTPPAWDDVTTYEAGDVVAVGSTYYQAVAESLNQTPPNASYWKVSPQKILVGKSGILSRVNRFWPDIAGLYLPGNLARAGVQFLGNVKVTYSAGYPDGYVPRELAYACRLQVSIMRQTAAKGFQLQSESVTDYSYALKVPSPGQAPEIGSIRKILTRFRDTPGLGGNVNALPASNTRGWR